MDTNNATMLNRLTNMYGEGIVIERNIVRKTARGIVHDARIEADKIRQEAKRKAAEFLQGGADNGKRKAEEQRLSMDARVAESKKAELVPLLGIVDIPALQEVYKLQIAECDSVILNVREELINLEAISRSGIENNKRQAAAVLAEGEELARAIEAAAASHPTVILIELVDNRVRAFLFRLIERCKFELALQIGRNEDMPGIYAELCKAKEDKRNRIAAAQEIVSRMAKTREDLPPGAAAIVRSADQFVCTNKQGVELTRWVASPNGIAYKVPEMKRTWNLVGANVAWVTD